MTSIPAPVGVPRRTTRPTRSPCPRTIVSGTTPASTSSFRTRTCCLPRTSRAARELPAYPAVFVLAAGEADPARTGSGGLLPVHAEAGLLRVLRVGDGHHAARDGHPGAARRRLHHRAVRRFERAVRRARAGRARVGRGVFPAVRLDRVRAHSLTASLRAA